jgi:hypothetical protein
MSVQDVMPLSNRGVGGYEGLFHGWRLCQRAVCGRAWGLVLWLGGAWCGRESLESFMQGCGKGEEQCV